MMRLSDILAIWDAAETWRAVEGWPYEVSSWGNVRRSGSPVSLKPGLTVGYGAVSLSRNGEVRTFRVHRLVAAAFLGEPTFEGAIVAHADGNTLNNRASNLRWASARENQADRARHGTRVHGSAVFGAKLREDDIPVIRCRIAAGERYQDIADDYGVSASAIYCIRKNKTWRDTAGAAWRAI